MGPRVRRGVQSIARIITGFIQLGLAHFEHVHLDRSVGSGQENGRRLDPFCPLGSSEDLELRKLTEEPVDDVEVNRCSVWICQPTQHGKPTDDDGGRADARSNFGDPLNDRSHRIAEEVDPATRHGCPTCSQAPNR